MDCLYAKVNMFITTCVLAGKRQPFHARDISIYLSNPPIHKELEKLGPKFRLAMRVAKSENFEVLKCQHKGIYADDCIFDRVSKSRIYIVGTDDKPLQQRLRKLPGVPIMKVARGKYVIERLPGAPSS
jgi:U3 small nucleolar RNA-associated protein 24